MLFGDMIAKLTSLSRPRRTSDASGMFIVSLTWDGSTTSTLLTALVSVEQLGHTLVGSIARSRLAFTAVASNGVPSENAMPVRSVNVQLIESGASCHDSA